MVSLSEGKMQHDAEYDEVAEVAGTIGPQVIVVESSCNSSQLWASYICKNSKGDAIAAPDDKYEPGRFHRA